MTLRFFAPATCMALTLSLATVLPAHAQEPKLEQCPFAATEVEAVFGVKVASIEPEGDIEMDDDIWLRSCRYQAESLQFRVVVYHYLKRPERAKQALRVFYGNDRASPIPRDPDGGAFLESRDGTDTPTFHYPKPGMGVTLLVFDGALKPIRGKGPAVKALQAKLASMRRLP